MNENVLGTDINYNWLLDPEGDIDLVHGRDNLSQGIYLRLSAYLNSLDWCYNNYGSTLKDWLGKNQNPYTSETMLDEIEQRVLLDPRVNTCNVDVVDWEAYHIGIHITANVLDDETYDDYYIFSTLREKDELMYNPVYKDTHIKTRDMYYAKQGELITVSCIVLDENYKRVPTGEVLIKIGGYTVDIENNPSYLNQSGSGDPGAVSFTFRVPLFIALGEHELIFKYKGIYGYNGCQKSITFKVVDKLPTRTQFIYPKKEYQYYHANDVDLFTDPVVYVEDYNEMPVRMGTVEYYLDDDEVYGTRLVVDSALIFLDGELIEKRVILRTTEKLLEYTNLFMFNLLSRQFHNKDILRLESIEGELIDTLECIYNHGVYYLQTTEKRVNCNIHLRVME